MKHIVIVLLFVHFAHFASAQVHLFNPVYKPFYHGVASGDPLEDRVIIWTRVTPENETFIEGNYVIATDTALKQIIKTGNFSTDISRDYTVKIDVDGLDAGTTYYYAFIALGKRSPIGRTKTTPATDENNVNEVLRFGLVSCSNYEGGYFNAYRTLAERNDLDAVIHLGDYIYEYAPKEYRNALLPDSARTLFPPNELLSKTDYRSRYSLYRLDPDLARLHQQHPMIVMWDDHEFADNAYISGAENHQANEGDWDARVKIAKEVYYEWMPIRGNADHSHLYRNITYGKLLDLFILDTRMDERQKPPETFDAADDTLNPRQIMSATQFDWLINHMKNSEARWKAVADQIVFSDLNVGFAANDPTNYDEISAYENLFLESWEGYRLQRNAIIDSLQKNKINNVLLLSGDSHCSWAFDVTKEPVLYPLAQYGFLPVANPFDSLYGSGYTPETGAGSACVEICPPSISAANFNEELDSDSLAALFEYIFNIAIPGFPDNTNYNPHLKYLDLDQHGYVILDVRADSIQADFFYTTSLTEPNANEIWAAGVSSLYNSNHITNAAVTKAAPEKIRADIPAPDPNVVTGLKDPSNTLRFVVYPNPGTYTVNIEFELEQSDDIDLCITDVSGLLVKTIAQHKFVESRSQFNQLIDVGDLKPGVYFIRLRSGNQLSTWKILIQ
jgi:alkaline phosphatase D